MDEVSDKTTYYILDGAGAFGAGLNCIAMSLYPLNELLLAQAHLQSPSSNKAIFCRMD
jgi:hypothetical protein